MTGREAEYCHKVSKGAQKQRDGKRPCRKNPALVLVQLGVWVTGWEQWSQQGMHLHGNTYQPATERDAKHRHKQCDECQGSNNSKRGNHVAAEVVGWDRRPVLTRCVSDAQLERSHLPRQGNDASPCVFAINPGGSEGHNIEDDTHSSGEKNNQVCQSRGLNRVHARSCLPHQAGGL